MFEPSEYNIIDLTLPYTKGMVGYEYETAKTVEEEGWNARILHLYSHAGTHMDAPLHFNVTEQTIVDYPVSTFVGKAWVIPIEINQPKQLLTVDDLAKIAPKFNSGESLLLQTKWSQYVGELKYRDHLPRISQELAGWCVQHKVNMLGVEAPSVADVNDLDEVTEIHRTLLGGGVVIIEGLTNLTAIKKEKVILTALPLKIEGGDGAPARVIAFEKI